MVALSGSGLPDVPWLEVVRGLNEGALLSPTVILASHDLVRALKQEFPAVEVLSKRAFLSDIFASTTAGTENRMLASYLRSDQFLADKSKCLKMFDRSDPSGTFRLLEREVMMLSLVRRIFGLVSQFELQGFVADVTPHHPAEYMASRIFAFLGHPTIIMQPTNIGSVVFPRGSWSAQSGFRDCSSVTQGTWPDHETKLEIENFIDGLFDVHHLPPYIEKQLQHDREVDKRGVLLRARILWRAAVKPNDLLLPVFLMPGWLRAFIGRAAALAYRAQLRSELRRAYVGDIDNANLPAVLYALHYEPERTVNPEGGDFASQLEALAFIRSILEERYVLYVKEHYSQFSARLQGSRGRSPWFYRLINDGFEGSILLPPELSLGRRLATFDAIFTLTGTIGLQASALGIPVG